MTGPLVTVIPNPAAIAELGNSHELREYLLRIGADIAADARAHGPHRAKNSRHGVETIHPEITNVEGHLAVDVSWDREHYYLRFPEKGTVHQPPRPFLVPAFDRYVGGNRVS
jgi:HK97 gp10 family phage protein